MRLRAHWVRKQTELRNKIRALLAQQTEEIRLEVERQERGLFTQKGLDILKTLPLAGEDKMILDDLLRGHREVAAHIKQSDGLVEALYSQLEEASRIDTVPGFATTLSVLAAVEIADIRRFAGPGRCTPMPASCPRPMRRGSVSSTGTSLSKEAPGFDGPCWKRSTRRSRRTWACASSTSGWPKEGAERGQGRGGPAAADDHLSDPH